MTSFISTTGSGDFRIYYKSWGDPAGKPLVCVHGLTGSSADFKFVGEYLANKGFYTIAPDMPGRGDSEFLKNPDLYNFDEYLQHLRSLMKHLQLGKVDWLGVSMGGLLGLLLASEPDSRIKRLILSDVGPEVPVAALEMIKGYLTLAPVFSTMEDVVGAFKQSIGTPFYRGPMTEAEWLYYASTHVSKKADGLWSRSFDPGILHVFRTQPLGDVDLWAGWEKLTQPVLTLHGGLSVLLTDDICKRMAERKTGSPMDYIKLSDCGHVPSLYPDAQIRLLETWLAA